MPISEQDQQDMRDRFGPVPHTVVILAMGQSHQSYILDAFNSGDRRSIADEVWGLNNVIDSVVCDRAFVMDDIKHLLETCEAGRKLQRRFPDEPEMQGFIPDLKALFRRKPELETEWEQDDELGPLLKAMIAREEANCGLARWCRSNISIPLITSTPYPEYPMSQRYPLEHVAASLPPIAYFNCTAAYTVAFATWLGVKRIIPCGLDFTYPNRSIAEAGRACVEMHLLMAMARGIQVEIPETSTLFDVSTLKPLYGYYPARNRIRRSVKTAGGKEHKDMEAAVEYLQTRKTPAEAKADLKGVA